MDLVRTKDLLIKTLERDSSRLDVVQEVAKVYYYLQDYQEAYKYYSWFTAIKDSLNLGIFPAEDARIALVLSKLGKQEESARYLEAYREFSENDQSMYRDFLLSSYYAYQGETDKALEHLQLFSQQDDYFYWIIIFFEIDPMIESLLDLPEFKNIMIDIKTKFWVNHQEIKASLQQQGLL